MIVTHLLYVGLMIVVADIFCTAGRTHRVSYEFGFHVCRISRGPDFGILGLV